MKLKIFLFLFFVFFFVATAANAFNNYNISHINDTTLINNETLSFPNSFARSISFNGSQSSICTQGLDCNFYFNAAEILFKGLSFGVVNQESTEGEGIDLGLQRNYFSDDDFKYPLNKSQAATLCAATNCNAEYTANFNLNLPHASQTFNWHYSFFTWYELNYNNLLKSDRDFFIFNYNTQNNHNYNL